MGTKLIDTAAERTVLGGIIYNGFDAFIDADDIIRSTSFSDKSNQAVYLAIKAIFDEDKHATIEYPVLLSTISRLGFSRFFDSSLEMDHLKSIFATTVTVKNVRKFAAILRKLEITRGLQLKLDEIRGNLDTLKGTEPLGHILGVVENPVFDYIATLTDDENAEPKSIANNLEELVHHYAENPRDIVGISSGYAKYDQSIGGGFRRKSVSIIAARPKTGKTMLVNNIGRHVAAKLDIPVLDLDTEMSLEEQQTRYLSLVSGISIEDIETGKFAQDEIKKQRITSAVAKLKQNHAGESEKFYHVNIAGQPFEETLSLMRRWLFKVVGQTNGKTNDCLVILDYLKLMSAEGLNEHLQEYQRLGFMMTSLHNFAVKYDVPMLVFSQINRDGITKDTSDVVSGSDRIVFFCSNLSLYKRKTAEEMAEDGIENGNRKLIPILARHGEGLPDGDYINLNFQGHIGTITEASSRNDIHFERQDYDDDSENNDGEEIKF